ncbi:type I-MYXAN CRISPR-associated protein Cas5/Cmx5/DevS [Myxococcota bacterium]|nr:type I-MYXAN CRISPR-associated protein Cas5/Cmx5/DevS [Myxococcota bacterium]
MSSSFLSLFVSVPIASFRVAQAREYWETYPCPPPSTVYGMLLSLVGEEDRFAHQGAEIATALLLPEPSLSRILRKTWRVKKLDEGLGRGNNVRPDFQELLTGVRLGVFLRSGPNESTQHPTLYERVQSTLAAPSQIRRFGGLSLGESTHLVDELRLLRSNDAQQGALWLSPSNIGSFSLPIWPNHVGLEGTRWQQFRLEEAQKNQPLDPSHVWVTIRSAE